MSTSFPPIYVLSVKTFTDRINHIQNELKKHNLQFEFIFNYDVYDIDEKTDKQFFLKDSNLSPAAKSITLKHITAWRNAVLNNYKQILVFEDDVVLNKNFTKNLTKLLEEIKKIPQEYLVFLGGADTKVPKEFFLSHSILYELNMPTAEGYITDLPAIQKRLAWLESNKIYLPADHATVKIDNDCRIKQYWVRQPLITQGSVFGLFPTTLDKSRSQKSPILNRLIFEWKKLKRRTLPQTFYNITGIFRKK
ncbi:glycosyltransferase family 25 protein [Polynucleobacter victoriensis]|uniref:Glycosyl transferase, family 25 n=1 Tax=Polynucleobacter victoriensis TaxID=2049319 RepID=A0A212T7S7_9BURK|nr:glycosyltransferase family 25 protein [Polynucleobacter victoriensis]SNC62113.1 glycosyl transferase, family 25 [Polynucleobacter victoriensis]